MLDDDTSYWSQFWIERGQVSLEDDPQTQVLRTNRGQPIDEETFQPILTRVLTEFELHDSDEVLELCCGNGVFSIPLSRRCRSVHGVDVSREFIDSIDTETHSNIVTQAGDIRRLEFQENQFDRVLMYAGIQYFSQAETFVLLKNIKKWLRPNGILFLGDIPDAQKRWAFFRTEEQRRNYFECLASGKPIIGNWFPPDWLRFAGEAAGFVKCELLSQPEGFPYAHFRYDMRFRTPK